MDLNNGTVIIGNCFDFGQSNCYDTIEMTNSNDTLMVGGNWTYITLTDMEGKWTAGNIWFLGPTWEVNEASGDKSIYSSGTQTIYFGYAGSKQTVLWDNCKTYINNKDGSLNTERTFNFNYKDEAGKCLGVVFSPNYSNENYHFRPYLPQYVTNLEDAVPYEEWKYMEDSNGNTIPDIVEKQIAEDPLNVDNAWLEDKYGCSVEEFIKTDNVNADKNKKTLVETLSYLYNHYIEPVADAASDYIGKSLNQIVKGNFTDDVTLLGTAGEIVLGIFDLDLVCDLRDIAYDIGEWGEIIIGDDEFSWSFAGQSFIDLVGIIPVIGILKYSDEFATLLKKSNKMYYNAVTDSIDDCYVDGKIIKSEDEINKIFGDNAKRYIKIADDLEELKGITKASENYGEIVASLGKFDFKNADDPDVYALIENVVCNKNLSTSEIASLKREIAERGGWIGKYYNSDMSAKWPSNGGFTHPLTDSDIITLQPGTVIDRYGYAGGSYLSPINTPYKARAVEPGTISKPYNVYVVKEPIRVYAGEVAPWFGMPGGGTQYYLGDGITVQLLLEGSNPKLEVLR